MFIHVLLLNELRHYKNTELNVIKVSEQVASYRQIYYSKKIRWIVIIIIPQKSFSYMKLF